MEWEIKLTEEEIGAFQQITACKAACDELIRKLVAEWEDAFMVETALWDALVDKYELNVEKYKYEYSPKTKKLIRSSHVEDSLKDLEGKFTKRKRIKDYLLNKFNKK